MSLNNYFKNKTAAEIMSESNLDRLFPNPGNEFDKGDNGGFIKSIFIL